MMDAKPPKNERDEKEEKQHEKEEKGRSDPLSAATWGAIVIWAGLVFLADNLGLLTSLGDRGIPFPGRFIFFRFETWALIFLGAGVIILVEVLLRLVLPDYRRPVAGNVILAIVFLGIGLGNLISWNVIWPLVLIAIGGLILLRGLGWRR
ncbi:MAG TPA: hypothetical protein VF932_08095 [Anaerolineae bacterium]